MHTLARAALSLALGPTLILAGCGGKIAPLRENSEGAESSSLDAGVSAAEAPIVPQIAAGANHACRLASTGRVVCWGENGLGQLGRGTQTFTEGPGEIISLLSKSIAVAAGVGHTCAIGLSGGVSCWGSNQQGQLGDGTAIDHLVPVPIPSLSAGVRAIALGDYHSCALLLTGGVKCWGYGLFGQLGDGVVRTKSDAPVDVGGLASGAIAIAAGSNHSCALLGDGVVKCWGQNSQGTLGDQTLVNSSTPVSVLGLEGDVVEVSAGTERTCVRTREGKVKCWGRGVEGELGDGLAANSLVPVTVASLEMPATMVASGSFQTCALLVGGAVKCWGWNGFGDLAGVTKSPVGILGLKDVTMISTGSGQSCSLSKDESVMCWGSNYAGALGGDSTDDALTPVPVELP